MLEEGRQAREREARVYTYEIPTGIHSASFPTDHLLRIHCCFWLLGKISISEVSTGVDQVVAAHRRRHYGLPSADP